MSTVRRLLDQVGPLVTWCRIFAVGPACATPCAECRADSAKLHKIVRQEDSVDTEAVQWVRGKTPVDLDDIMKRIILSVADLCGSGTGVVVDEHELAEYADVSVAMLGVALTNLSTMGLLATYEASMSGRLRLALPIPGRFNVIKKGNGS